MCTLKQTANHVNQPNKRNNGPSNHSSRIYDLTNKQGNYNSNGKLASKKRVNVVNTVPKNTKISESRRNEKYSKKKKGPLHYNCGRQPFKKLCNKREKLSFKQLRGSRFDETRNLLGHIN